MLGAAGAVLGAPSANARAAGPRPNLVVVLADDLGYGELGCYGQKLIRTPVVDELARQGLRFTQAYAAAAVCAPSRCSLLTGLDSGHARVRQNPRAGLPGGLRAADTTVAEVLRWAGYRTGLFGKWGFGPDRPDQASHPNAHGFQEFYGYLTHHAAHDYRPDHLWHDDRRVALHGAYAPDLLRDQAVRFARRKSDDPFLLFFSPNLPHAPSTVPSQGRYAHRNWPKADRGHAAQVTRLDSHIGDLVAAVKDADRPTVVLVTSDNGPHEEGGVNPDRFNANGPLRGYKRNIYEGGIRVPFVAWSPGLVRRGTSGRLTQHTDLLPTLAELGGAAVPGGLDGASLAGVLTGRGGAPAPGHRYWYRSETHETRRANATEHGSVTRLAEAVRRGRWKLVRFAPGERRPARRSGWRNELYDLTADPGEKRDVASRHPRLVAELADLADASWS
ncbi:arylsulfatase [Actinocorallia longicatena]|uniref:Arylsulfatase n=1 Tax=Actinocorallia longicatena TaxID=111803 RepID=A0ABP6Q9B4_9ACTN